MKEWLAVLTEQSPAARQILSKLLEDKIVLRPTTLDGEDAYEVEANFTLRGFFAGIVGDSRTVELCPVRVASPTGFEPVFWP